MGLPFAPLAPILGSKGGDARLLPDAIHAWIAGTWTTHDGGGGITNVDAIANLIQPAYPIVYAAANTDLRATTLSTGFPAWDNSGAPGVYSIAAGIPGGSLSKGSLLFVGQGNLSTGGQMWSMAAALGLAGVLFNDVGGGWADFYLGGPEAAYMGPEGNDFIGLLTWDLTPASGSRLTRGYLYSPIKGSKTQVKNNYTGGPPTLTDATVGKANGFVSTGCLCGSLQVGNSFIADADAAAVFARLKTAFGY